MKYSLIAGLSLFSLALLPTVAAAETIVIPVGQQTAGQSVTTPRMGMTMAAVEAEFGSPQKRDAARGTPPITRWEYGQFAVYFESNQVIHSVIRFKPHAEQP